MHGIVPNRATASVLLTALAAAVPATRAAPAAAAPTWLPSTSLASVGPTGSECPPITAADQQGDVFAVWVSQEEGNRFVQVSSRPAGGNWQAPTSFPQPSPCVEGVASDARGDALAVWDAFDGKEHSIEASYRVAGGSWQSPATIASAPGGEVLPAGVALDPHGNALAVWRSNAVGSKVEYSSRPASGGWTTPQPVSGETNNWYLPQVAIDGAGNAVAIWQHRVAGGKEQIQAARMPAGGGWQPAVNLTEPFTEVFRGSPKIAINAAGQATAVWAAGEPGKEIIQSATMNAAGSWQPAVGLTEAGQNAEAPQVATNARGDAVAAWEFTFEAKAVIQAALRPAGAAWGSATRLSEAGEDARYPHVAVAPSGEVVAVWERYNGSNNIIQSAAGTGSGAWGPAINISKEGENSLGTAVSMDAQGNAVSAWESHDPGGYEVYAAGYDAAGPLQNALSIPASGIAGQPVTLSVDPLDVWSGLGASNWTFGDGASASGTGVTHTYAVAGSYHVTLTSADVLGNTTSASGTTTITASPAGKGQRPSITSLRQSASTWREGRRLAQISSRPRRPPVGTTFTVAVSMQAVVRLTFTQRVSGRMVNGKCVAQSRKNAKHKPCRRSVVRGTISFTEQGGTSRVAFQGRISRSRRLSPGRYTLTVTAVNSAGAAVPRSLSFTIVK